jgi:hypothetical protein
MAKQYESITHKKVSHHDTKLKRNLTRRFSGQSMTFYP